MNAGEKAHERRGFFRRRARFIMIIFVIATSVFFGAAGFAVWNASQERHQQDRESRERDEVICLAVAGVRRDLVEVISEQKSQSLKNVRKLGLDVEQAKKNYKDMLSKIGDEECP